MSKQIQVEGFERDLRRLMADYELEQEKLLAHHSGEMTCAVQEALRALHNKKNLAVELLRIEWGL